ncbi:MAG: endonuclease/exonuclease/phosphatase family protein [Actinomycetaceae bacterium]|nr:endonuclease/exonuclease/phosphatase family protein [Actinomycetaceae bacterium]
MRIVSWNTQYGTTNSLSELGAGRHSEPEFRDALRQIAALEPDVVAFQEVERGQGRSARMDQPRIIAQELKAAGMAWTAFAPSYMGWGSGLRLYPDPDVRQAWPAFGVMLAMREQPRAWKIARLGKAPIRWVSRGPKVWQGKPAFGETRVLLAAVHARGEVFGTTHLEIHPDTAKSQARRAFNLLASLGHPVTLIGDFNLSPAAVADALDCNATLDVGLGSDLNHLEPGRTNISATTFPAALPRANMDQAVIDPGKSTVPILGAGALQLSISDHAALVVETGDITQVAREAPAPITYLHEMES